MGEMRGRIPVLASLAVVAVSVGGALGSLDPPAQSAPVGDTAAASTTTTRGMTRIHVSGMVRAPGVVDVPEGSIVADAIAAAGGLRADAVVDRINLAAPVADGDQIVVPGPGDQVEVGSAGQAEDGGPISLSSATAAELETLPGVGPVLAERIVAFRDQSGRFDEVEDLLEVPGIGEAKLAAIRDLVRP